MVTIRHKVQWNRLKCFFRLKSRKRIFGCMRDKSFTVKKRKSKGKKSEDTAILEKFPKIHDKNNRGRNKLVKNIVSKQKRVSRQRQLSERCRK